MDESYALQSRLVSPQKKACVMWCSGNSVAYGAHLRDIDSKTSRRRDATGRK
jgi:hypothetical protein